MPLIATDSAVQRRPRHRTRRVWCILLLAGSLLVATNFALVLLFHNRTYPHTMLVGVNVGNMRFADVARAAQAQHVPDALDLTRDTLKLHVKSSDVGLSFDASRTQESLQTQRSWIPLVALFTKHWVPAPIALSQTRLASKTSDLTSVFHKDPTDAHVTLNDATFGVSEPANGYTLDATTLGSALVSAIDHGSTTVEVPTKTVSPQVTKSQAQADAKKLQDSLHASLSYTYAGASRQPSAGDIAKWYQASGTTYVLNDFAIRTYIETTGVAMGVHPSNLSAAVASTKQALDSKTASTVALTPFNSTKTYHYCVQTRGADAQYVSGLKEQLTGVYADLRGWSLDGQVTFEYATSGCDFTVWLASSDQMSTFGAICDNYWDCEIGGNVVVNLDRWLNTTPSWQSSGGSLSDYRTLLINHETGHMLGFLDNYVCPVPGGPAPIMLQQSINLRGCIFNIWPTPPELTALRQMIGL
ncbi:MAG TPA: DUF3152 domain-containing protein [Candidatus Saccharimonadales bacterium]|nr:DUF3152 domain-containing protein [Candidatus Saccharimonadales bacterium]